VEVAQALLDASTRIQALAFWGVLVFVLEALLFVLLGQQLPRSSRTSGSTRCRRSSSTPS
jgi:NhaP-type Na+/H+ or K+/H+ antiporter